MAVMRLFIAVDIGEEIRSALEAVQQRLAGLGADVRWLKPASMHLTLKFLGDTDEELTGGIVEVMDACAPCHETHELTVKGLGAFPNPKRARVVWAGLGGDVDSVKALQADLESMLEQSGFPREGRAFSPHLTLGRVKSAKNLSALARAVEADPDVLLGSFPVSELILYRSELFKSGARYTSLARASLA